MIHKTSRSPLQFFVDYVIEENKIKYFTIMEVNMPGVYEVYIKTHFSAAHALIGYDGDCANIHGHNWIIEVYVRCSKLNEIGIGIDFRDIKSAVKDTLKIFDHCNLNDLPEFSELNPTSENIACVLYKMLAEKLNSESTKISKIKVSETPGAGAYYREE